MGRARKPQPAAASLFEWALTVEQEREETLVLVMSILHREKLVEVVYAEDLLHPAADASRRASAPR